MMPVVKVARPASWAAIEPRPYDHAPVQREPQLGHLAHEA